MVTSLCIYQSNPAPRTLSERCSRGTGRRCAASTIYAGEEGENEPIFVELLHWRDPSGAETAHELPDVMAVWEPMGKLCEERRGRPSMEFPRVEPLEIAFAE